MSSQSNSIVNEGAARLIKPKDYPKDDNRLIASLYTPSKIQLLAAYNTSIFTLPDMCLFRAHHQARRSSSQPQRTCMRRPMPAGIVTRSDASSSMRDSKMIVWKTTSIMSVRTDNPRRLLFRRQNSTSDLNAKNFQRSNQTEGTRPRRCMGSFRWERLFMRSFPRARYDSTIYISGRE